MGTNHNLSNILKAIRISQKKSQIAFAKEVGISKSTLQEIESGKNPNLDTLNCIAKNLNLPVSALLCDTISTDELSILIQITRGLDWFFLLPKHQQTRLLQLILEIAKLLSTDTEQPGERL